MPRTVGAPVRLREPGNFSGRNGDGRAEISSALPAYKFAPDLSVNSRGLVCSWVDAPSLHASRSRLSVHTSAA